MAIRKFPGTPTADLELAWDVVAAHEGWKIEVHKEFLASLANKLVFWRDWNPVRLLGPDGTLWASAATVEEMNDALPGLMAELAAKKPMFTRDDVQKAAEALGSILMTVVTRKMNAPGPKGGR
jgi:hypothetical protein